MSRRESVFLLPGEFSATRTPTHYGTLLGSCVSVCVSNISRGIAAMNHFLLPNADGTGDIGRFGETSTDHVLKALLAVDPDPTRYDVRIFGGAALLGAKGSVGRIGERNVEVAREIVARYRMRVVEEDVGGTRGRRVDFYTDENTAVCRPLGTRLGSEGAREIRVVIVDTSALVRRVLRAGIEAERGMLVVAEASDPFQARDRILETAPDVITLDTAMPAMDGLTFLRHLMARVPKPVVIVSASAKPGSATVVDAARAGAFASIDKDELQVFRGPERTRLVLAPKLREAVRVGVLRSGGAWAAGGRFGV